MSLIDGYTFNIHSICFKPMIAFIEDLFSANIGNCLDIPSPKIEEIGAFIKLSFGISNNFRAYSLTSTIWKFSAFTLNNASLSIDRYISFAFLLLLLVFVSSKYSIALLNIFPAHSINAMSAGFGFIILFEAS